MICRERDSAIAERDRALEKLKRQENQVGPAGPAAHKYLPPAYVTRAQHPLMDGGGVA